MAGVGEVTQLDKLPSLPASAQCQDPQTPNAVNALPVSGAPTVSLVASPQFVARGDDATLRWTTTNANQCTLFDEDASHKTSRVVPPNGGYALPNVTAATLYTLECSNPKGVSVSQQLIQTIGEATQTFDRLCAI